MIAATTISSLPITIAISHVKQGPEWGAGLFYLTMTTALPRAYRSVRECRYACRAEKGKAPNGAFHEDASVGRPYAALPFARA